MEAFDEFDAEYNFLDSWRIVPAEEVKKNPECFRKPKIEESTMKRRNGMKTFDEFFNTNAEARKKLHESLFGKEEQEIEELEEELECEVKLEKTPDPAKEEIFATCLNFLHNHTEDELYEIVRLAFKAAEVFGY